MFCKLLTALLVVPLVVVPVFAQKTDDPSKSNVFLGGDKPKKDKPATSRTVKGIVLDAGGQPAQGALVTLNDLKTHETWTFVTKVDGHYHFDDLSFVVDYEVGAKKGTDASIAKKLSQYDRTPTITRNLDLEKAPATPSEGQPAAKDAKQSPKN